MAFFLKNFTHGQNFTHFNLKPKIQFHGFFFFFQFAAISNFHRHNEVFTYGKRFFHGRVPFFSDQKFHMWTIFSFFPIATPPCTPKLSLTSAESAQALTCNAGLGAPH